MESLSRETAGHILQRLDKLQKTQELQLQKQTQLDHVTDRLDTVQNMLETQNRSQISLSEKLEQIKMLLKEQMRYAQTDILTRIIDLQSKQSHLQRGHGFSQSENTSGASQMRTLAGLGCESKMKDFQERLSRVDEKMTKMNNVLSENSQSSDSLKQMSQSLLLQTSQSATMTAHMSQNLLAEISQSTQMLACMLHISLTETTNSSKMMTHMSQTIVQWLGDLARKFEMDEGIKEEILARSKEICEAQSSMKAQIKAELAWLDNKMDSVLCDVSAKLNKKLEMVSDKITCVQTVLREEEEIHGLKRKAESISLLEHATGASSYMEAEQQKHSEAHAKVGKQTKGVSKEKTENKSITFANVHSNTGYQEINEEKHLDHVVPAEEKNKQRAEISNLNKKTVYEAHDKPRELKDIVRHIGDKVEELDKQIHDFQTKLEDKLSVSMDNDLKIDLEECYKRIREDNVSHNDRLLNQTMKSLKQYLDTSNPFANIEMGNCLQKQFKDVIDALKDHTNKTSEKSVHETVSALEQYFTTADNDMKRQIQTSFQKEMEDCVNELKDHVTDVKFEVYAVTEKEGQLVRDQIEAHIPLTRPKRSRDETYTFDFYIPDFKSLIDSGKCRKSVPWYIKKFKSSVQGYVHLNFNGEFVVFLNMFRHSLEVGLQPRYVEKADVKATITDVNEKVLPDIEIGELTISLNDDKTCVPDHDNWGVYIWSVLCDDLIQKGYADKEGYSNGAILVRYRVTIP